MAIIWIHFGRIHFGNRNLEAVGPSFRKTCMLFSGLRTLCTKWFKCKSGLLLQTCRVQTTKVKGCVLWDFLLSFVQILNKKWKVSCFSEVALANKGGSRVSFSWHSPQGMARWKPSSTHLLLLLLVRLHPHLRLHLLQKEVAAGAAAKVKAKARALYNFGPIQSN